MIVCFGEMLLRLATARGRLLSNASSLDVVVGGAEANVAVALAALGHGTRMVTVLPDNPLGDCAAAELAMAGVDPSGVRRAGGRMGLYFLETGGSLRPSAVTYDREGSAFARAEAGDFDFARLLAGARLLHLSGITAALGPRGLAASRAAIAAAHAAGVPVSFDPNYRATLWSAWDSQPREALGELAAGADILFAGPRDIALLLGPMDGEDAAPGRAFADAAFAAFPRLTVLASTQREALSQTHHRLAARVDRRDDRYQSAAVEVTDIVDRVGTGDAFAAGVLDAWLGGGDARALAETGLTLAVLKHSIAGDSCRVRRADLLAFATGAGDVRR